MKRVFITLLLTVLCIMYSMPVSALEEFKTEKFTQGEYIEIVSGLKLEYSDKYSPDKYAFERITSFCVSERGMIAVSIEGRWVPLLNSQQDDDYIVIMDSDGEIVSALRYNYPWSYEISLEWNGENLLIIEKRGGLLFEVNVQGEIVDIYNVRSEENYDVIFERDETEECVFGDATYCAIRKRSEKMFMDGYSAIVKTEAEGASTVLFDINDYTDKNRIVPFLIFAGVFIAWVVIMMMLTIIHNRKKKKDR